MSGTFLGPRSTCRPSFVALLLVLAAGIPACGGGGTSPTPPPPPPPPPPSGRIASVAAGNQQTALVGQAVAVAPAVRVVNSAGGAVAGVAVTFAVGSGGGTVTGPSQTTGSDGIATVGSWVLGDAGPNTLLATVADATGGSPVTFTASGQDLVVSPSADSTITGTVVTTRFTVPAGVTVTLGTDVVIQSTVRVTINGTIRGDCRRFEIDATGEVLITGTVNTSCSDPAAAAPALRIVGRGGYSLSGAVLRSGGSVEITNDPTVTDASFATMELRTERPSAADLLSPPCSMAATQYLATPARAAAGAIGGTKGGDGASAQPVNVRCRGLLAVTGGVEIVGQHGGNGAQGFDANGTLATAEGGKGGTGGIVRLSSVGDVVFTGSNTLRSGDGGEGGRALANGQFGAGTPAKAAGAKATGGAGGNAGPIVLLATGALAFNGPTQLTQGTGGPGGDGIATAARGAGAGAGPAQHGGDAEATGGAGGLSPDLQFAAGTSLTGQANAVLAGGAGGAGGTGWAVGGIGGNGNLANPTPGDGGRMTSVGGTGGESRLRRFGSQLVAPGGAGGHAQLEEGYGGNAASRCVANPALQAGLTGGRGGDMTATHGAGGPGAMAGVPGDNKFLNARGGGRGGDGWPSGGPGGQPGTQTLSKPAVISGPAPFQGQAGFSCLRVLGGSTGTGYQPPAPGGPPTCRSPSAPAEFVSLVNQPVDFTISFEPVGSTGAMAFTFGPEQFNPSLSGPSVTRTSPAYDPDTHGFFGARAIAYGFYDYCITSGPFTNVFRATAMVGGIGYDLGTVSYILVP